MTFTEILSSEFMCLEEKNSVLQKIIFLKQTSKYQKKEKIAHTFINALPVSFMHGKWTLKKKNEDVAHSVAIKINEGLVIP